MYHYNIIIVIFKIDLLNCNIKGKAKVESIILMMAQLNYMFPVVLPVSQLAQYQAVPWVQLSHLTSHIWCCSKQKSFGLVKFSSTTCMPYWATWVTSVNKVDIICTKIWRWSFYKNTYVLLILFPFMTVREYWNVFNIFVWSKYFACEVLYNEHLN